MNVDVIVVNYRSGEDTRAAVAAVAGPGVMTRVWDNSGELLGEEGVQGTGENLYYATPSNTLYRGGTAPHVLLLNPDVRLQHASLQRLVEHLDENPDSWGVAPRLLWPDGRDQSYLRRLPDRQDLALELAGPLRRVWRRRWERYRCLDVDLRVPQAVEQPPAACLLLRRAAVGPDLFDERLPLFFNDVDLCRRLGPGCYYLADVTAIHAGGGSVQEGRRAGVPISRIFEDGLLTYARMHTGGTGLLRAIVALRRLARPFAGRR